MTTSVEPIKKERKALLSIPKVAGVLLIIAGAVLTLLPFYLMFIYATLKREDIFGSPPAMWFGHDFRTNYDILVSKIPFWRSMWNNFYIAFLVMACQIFFSGLVGFAFAAYNFRGRNFIFGIVQATLLIPAILNLLPYALLLKQFDIALAPMDARAEAFFQANLAGIKIGSFALFDWVNHLFNWFGTPKALWIPGLVGALGIFMVRQYISSALPKDLFDAARIDGCSEFGIYWRIVLPLIRPILGTLGLITFIGSWNRFADSAYILSGSDSSIGTAPVVLQKLQGNTSVEWGAIMAGTALLVIPLLILFVFAARQLMDGLTSGSIKS